MNKKTNKASAGKRGETVRSDCYIEIIKRNSGGLEIEFQSKVKSMYGKSIIEQIEEMCKFFHLKNGKIIVEDNGALPFVISARFEAAYKRLFPDENKEYLLPMLRQNRYSTAKDKLRRSRLYLPGNEPKFFLNAGLHKPDGIILDLEDSVAPSEKDSARILVRNALCSVDFYGCERMVRINQGQKGIEDLKYIIPHNVNVVLIPKCELPEQVVETILEIRRIKVERKIKNEVYVMPIIESAKGIIHAYEIASASPNVCSLAIGLEDYTADIGTQRTPEGKESFFARSMIINAAKAAGIQAIDTVFSDVTNMEGLKESVIEAKKIVLAFEYAEKKGLGVVALGSKMIDAPVVKRAQKTIELAVLNNLLNKNWRK